MDITPKHGINSATISVNNGRVYIDGMHYRFAHGYLSRRVGQLAINISDILSVGYIRGMSKLALLGVFLFGFLFLIVDNIFVGIGLVFLFSIFINDALTFSLDSHKFSKPPNNSGNGNRYMRSDVIGSEK